MIVGCPYRFRAMLASELDKVNRETREAVEVHYVGPEMAEHFREITVGFGAEKVLAIGGYLPFVPREPPDGDTFILLPLYPMSLSIGAQVATRESRTFQPKLAQLEIVAVGHKLGTSREDRGIGAGDGN